VVVGAAPSPRRTLFSPTAFDRQNSIPDGILHQNNLFFHRRTRFVNAQNARDHDTHPPDTRDVAEVVADNASIKTSLLKDSTLRALALLADFL
jgi:hypothetical protein